MTHCLIFLGVFWSTMVDMRAALALCVALAPPLAQTLVVQTCYADAPAAHEAWALLPSGLLQLAGGAPALQCAAVAAWPPPASGAEVGLLPCNASSPAQLFALLPNASLVLAALPSHCLNLRAYGTAPGTDAWVTPCDAAACQGNCAWAAAANATLVNSGLCLQDGSALPPLPHTCAPGSPAAGLPFCSPALDVRSRVDDLLARLLPSEKVALFNMGTGGFPYIPRLNVKAWHHDFTCIHGVNYPNGLRSAPALNVSVFPHAIAQAATFDLALVAGLSAATAYEARALNQALYAATGGTLWAGTSCDGGPLANTVHDPRWGRVSECYGEDVALASAVGVAATRALQNRSADGRWLRTAQVTRHWLGYHMATDLPRGGEEEVGLHGFADLQAPVYRALLVEGGAEGIMCGYAAFSIGGGPLVPSCMHPFLWEKLRGEWGWGGFVQTDCCDSITSAVEDHHYFANVSDAALSAIELGVSVYFGFNAQLVGAVGAALASNALDADLFDERLRAPLLMRFRTGEFDAGSGRAGYPYDAPLDVGALDGAEHRALARAAVSASVVLLENRRGALPLALRSGASVAVIGPFADCQARGVGDRDVDAPLACSYEHTYGGQSGAVSTILGAAREEGAAGGWRVDYAQGSNIVSELANGTAAAAAAAAGADATLLVLGLGMLLEVEGVDRATLRLPLAQQALLAAVAAAARGPLVLCLVSAGMADADFSLPQAVLQVFYPGAETGHGLWDVLLGRLAPSARLPVTAYKEAYLAAMHDSIANFSLVSSTGVGKTYRYADDNSAFVAQEGTSARSQRALAHALARARPTSPQALTSTIGSGMGSAMGHSATPT